MKRKIKTRIIALFMAVMMCLSLFPTGTFADDNDAITVYMTFEGYNLGQGYFIEPISLSVPAGTTVSDAVYGLLTDKGYLQEGLPSYLTGINFDVGKIDTDDIPSYLTNQDGFEEGFDDSPYDEDWLSAFDYTECSGWMYTVNHEMAEEGAGTYTLEDGDVVRWQFSLWGYGLDLGLDDFDDDWGYGTDAYYTHADKTELIRALSAEGLDKNVRKAAMAVAIDPEATEEEVLDALASLSDIPSESPKLTGLEVNTRGTSKSSDTYTATLAPDVFIHDGIRTDSNTRVKISVKASFDDTKYDLILEPATSVSDAADAGWKDIQVEAGLNEIKLILTDKTDENNYSEYVLKVLRPRGTTTRLNALSITGKSAYPALPLINGAAEGTLLRYSAVGSLGMPNFNPVGTLGTTSGFTAATYGYHAYIMSDNDVDVNMGLAATADAYVRVTVGDGEPQMFNTDDGNTFSINSGELTAGNENSTKVLIEVCSKETYKNIIPNSFVPEDSYIVILEKIPSLSPAELDGVKLKSLEAAVESGSIKWGSNEFNSDLSLSALLAPDNTEITLTGKTDAGVEVYKAAQTTSANLLTANEQGEYIISTTTGAASQVITTSKVINGTRITYPYTITILRKPTNLAAGGPDSVTGFIVPASQYSNAATGLYPEKTLNNVMLSLGNFGGHIAVKYDTPIKNDPEHPYGVDFTVYGNSFGGQGASEPGNVWISKDGVKWYLLAGSDYFDDNTVRDFKVTYTRNTDGTSAYSYDNENSINPGTMYKYPLKEYYPLYNWPQGDDSEIVFSGPLLSSSATDPYGSASAAFPAWGYPDVHSNGTVGGTFGNPYTLNYANDGTLYTGANANGGYGNGFDISWAIDEETGEPVYLDEINYIKVATASHIYAGAIGEKSTEVTAIIRTPEASGEDMTEEPTAIKVNGTKLDLTEEKLYYDKDDDEKVTIEVEGAQTVFINNMRGAERTYETAPGSGVIRVVVQEDNKAARIYYLYNQNQDTVSYETALSGGLQWIKDNTQNPQVGSIGGEWAVIALARGGVYDEQWSTKYLTALDTALADGGTITKWTDYERVTLALTALGFDASNYKGQNLTEAFKTYIPTNDRPNQNKSINADIFALIALNSNSYDGDTELFVDAILQAEANGGGWGLGSGADTNMTAMAIQVLAPYYEDDTNVKDAVDQALEWLGTKTIKDAETNAQMIVALSALGTDADTYVDDLLTYYDSVTGGFKRSDTINAMTTEQATYALVAYDRFKNNKNSLYDMTDNFITVTFRLIGADDHDEGEHVAYKTWIATREYKVPKDSKVSDVFALALEDSNLTAEISEYGYVSGITAPAVLGSFTLREATFGEYPNATYAGWMFCVNNTLSEVGMSDTKLAAKDAIMFFYTDDMNGGIDWESNDASNAPALAAPDEDPVDEADAQAVAQAKAYLEEALFSVPMSTANTVTEIRTWLRERLGVMPLKGVTATIGDITVIPAASGTINNPEGTAGSFTADIVLSKGSGSAVAKDNTVIRGKITAASYNPGVVPSNKINVSFRLIGAKESSDDVDLKNKDNKGGDYVTWIATKSYSMDKGNSVYDLFTKAIGDAGLTVVGANSNYIESISAPSVLGGYTLSEFSNGQFSGWMYTINGKHVGNGLKEQILKNGDKVVWHYVNDYRYEVSDWFDDPDYPTLGDKDTWNKWLDAPDVNPGKDGSTGGSPGGSGGGGSTGGGGGSTVSSGNTTIAPKADAKEGTAEITINQTTIDNTIAEAKKNKTSAIIIKPEIAGTANKVSVELPKSSVSAIVKEADAELMVETPVGTISLPQEALTAIALEASGSTVTMSMGIVEKEALTIEQQNLVGDNEVYDISIMSGGKNITSFDGKTITISLPYTLKKGETVEGVTIWYLNDKGELEKVECTYDEKTKMAVFKTTHLSKYLVKYEAPVKAWENPFADIKKDDWYYGAVKFAVTKGLFTGKTETAFSPNESMTRAMLVTVLHRLEGLPETTEANKFTDVKEGEWYAKAVIWANANNIVTGYGDRNFGTGDPITREQMAAILYRYAGYKGYDIKGEAELKDYADTTEISSWAKEAISWAIAKGLITGRSETTIAPKGITTRGETALILMRFIENLVK